MFNIFADDEYNHALKIHCPGVRASVREPSGCCPSQQVSPEAAAALQEVDEEIAARLRGDTPCL
jgi:hypothetical protein